MCCSANIVDITYLKMDITEASQPQMETDADNDAETCIGSEISDVSDEDLTEDLTEDPKDMLRRLLSERYNLEPHVIEDLVNRGHDMVTEILTKAGKVDVQLADALHLLPLVTEADIMTSLPALPQRNMRVWVLPACGDGSCLLTSLRISLDLMASTNEALRVLADPTTIPSGQPELSGERGSPNHSDNFRIRQACVAWYISPPSNLDIEMSDSVQYETVVDGKTILTTRPMTRADFIVMQMTESKRGDINMSPESKPSRNALALAYMSTQNQDRVWGSLPLIMAFAHIMKTPRSIRVYQIVQGKLQSIYQDVVPPGAPPLPPPQEDDALLTHVPKSYKIDQDDMTPWETSEEEDNTCPLQETATQNFIRLLYHPSGHYDALATDTQQRIVTTAFPSSKPFFK